MALRVGLLFMEPRLAQLMQRYPRLFNGRVPPLSSTVEPGWYEVVNELCCHIDALLPDEQARDFAVLQIKEKAGGLRFYFRLGTDGPRRDEVARLVQAAEQRAAIRCQHCAAPGKLTNDPQGGVATLCARHAGAGPTQPSGVHQPQRD